MSYFAMVTNRFEELATFYGDQLGFPIVERWDREHGRGLRFDIGGGTKLELIDNLREHSPLYVGDSSDRFHLVIEVDDIDSARSALSIRAPDPTATSWGAVLFELRDPDGTAVTFLQWTSGRRGVR